MSDLTERMKTTGLSWWTDHIYNNVNVHIFEIDFTSTDEFLVPVDGTVMEYICRWNPELHRYDIMASSLLNYPISYDTAKGGEAETFRGENLLFKDVRNFEALLHHYHHIAHLA